jgi:hypothetical protein
MRSKNVYAIAASFALTLSLIQTASAQDNRWNGTVGNNQWNNPANWTLGFVPPPGNSNTPYAGNIFLDAANGDTIITILPGDVETPGVGNDNSTRLTNGPGSIYNTIYGPEFGVTLNIYGSLSYDWMVGMVQNDPTPGRRSQLNMFSNSVLSTTGAAVGVGDMWWYREAPYVTMNMYSNSQFNSLGGAGLWLGGHVNLYDNSSFYINGYVNMENLAACNDGTRAIVVGGGTLSMPENSITGGNSGTVYDWIGRGILRAYGKGFDTNDLSIVDGGTNIVITPVPLGGALQRVYLLPLSKNNVNIGAFEQCTLLGDYPSVSGVLLSSSEPGVNPASFAAPVYTSSNPKVFTVDATGIVTAVGYGTATLTATVGAFSSTNGVSLTVAPTAPKLAHRYSFTETNGSTTVSDSVGGADGTVGGDASLNGTGQLVLSGNVNSAVTLPAGILSGVDEVTIETWATFPGTLNNFANLWAFGVAGGTGANYVTFSPHTGNNTYQANFGQGNPGFAGERDAVVGGVLDNQTNVQIVAVFHPFAGSETLYINGVQMATVSMYNNMSDPISYAGPTFTNTSILNFTLGQDPNNYIGQSLYSGDPGMLANVDEFRIYTNALTPAQIAADNALGPNALIGTSTSVSLTASLSGTNIVLKWPTTSALLSVMGSSSVGANAAWTPVTSPLTTDGSGNYQMTVPASGSAQFFRLQQ